MPVHYSFLYLEVGFVPAKHQSFPDAYLKYLRQGSKTTLKSFSKMEKSSMKTSKLSPRKSKKIAVIHRCKVAGVLHNLNGMRLKTTVPKGHVNVIFS